MRIEQGRFTRIAQNIKGFLLPEPITSIEVPDVIPLSTNHLAESQTDSRLAGVIQRVGEVLFPKPLTLEPVGVDIGENMRGISKPVDRSPHGKLSRTAILFAQKNAGSGKKSTIGDDLISSAPSVDPPPPKRSWFFVGFKKYFLSGDTEVRIPVFGVAKGSTIEERPEKGNGRFSLINYEKARIQEAAQEKKRTVNFGRKSKRKK